MSRTSDFTYDLPEEAIAQEAIEPRDAARLLDVAHLRDTTMRRFDQMLAPEDVLVVNNTRVRAARLRGTKPATGGAIEALLLREIEPGVWQTICRPGRRLHPGVELDFGVISGVVHREPSGGMVELRLWSNVGDVEDLLPLVGAVPLPPYFHGRLADDDRYQTVFAKEVGSAAAPTAGLHFTAGLLRRIEDAGVGLADVRLDIGLDTFRPILTETLEDHRIHRESYDIPEATAAAINSARRRGGRVVAVGTTVVRALESSASGDGLVTPGAKESNLFITPGYEFSVVDAVLTNFHAPGTTLIVLVAAMIGSGWRDVYDTALRRGYRFLSFGDAMFIDGVRRR